MKNNENFNDIIDDNKERVYIKDVRSIHLKFRNGVVKVHCHVRYMSSFDPNFIALIELISSGYTCIR